MSDPFRPLKNAFARYTTGITVVSCLDAERKAIGITVNSFNSVSLEPALVSWCLDDHTSVAKAFLQADHYAVSILAADQEEMSNRFATPGQHAFKEGEGEVFQTGAPLLKGRIAGFDCRLADRLKVGDHTILIGEIVHYDSFDAEPLVYCGRNYIKGPKISDGA
ncbi:flavin reductase family protein [Parvularcula sp. ZS-1/3]|uniref:Flavin reductase family protein n=1 Tax=Parvularcula mediterranea TaxID=2732508 RepID=A0A7Y3W661_9PROT|nr:flavin reductase family protein [Parvularcula mediterranea]